MDTEFKGEITFRTHSVVVEKDEERIYCFKHDDYRCEMKIFNEYDAMVEWVLEPFPTTVYGLVLEEK